MLVDLCQKVRYPVHYRAVAFAQLRCRFEWRDEMWKLLVAIEEELDTSQALLFRLELKAPAYGSLGSSFGASLWAAIARRVFVWQRLIVRDFCGDLV